MGSHALGVLCRTSLPSSDLCSSSGQLNQIQQLYNLQMWVIDMVCLYNMNLIAVASTDQKIGESLTAPRACARPLGGMHLHLEGPVTEPTVGTG